MSSNIGHIINSTLRPPNSRATFPVTFSNENKGGLHSYTTLTERNNIPQERRIVGMEVFVASGATKYLLSGGTSNSNWVAIPYFGSGSGPGATGYLPLSGGTMTGPININSNPIYQVGTISGSNNYLAISFYDQDRKLYDRVGREIIDFYDINAGVKILNGFNLYGAIAYAGTSVSNTFLLPEKGGTMQTFAMLSDLTGGSGAYLPTSGGTMFGNINMSGNNITNVITLDYTDSFGYSYIRNDSSGGIIYSENPNGNSAFVADPTGPHIDTYDASNNSASFSINAVTGQLTFSSIDNSSTDRGSLTFKGTDGIGIKNNSGATSYISNFGLTGNTIYNLPNKPVGSQTFAMLSDITGNTIDLSGYLKISAFTAYSATTLTNINNRLLITNFNSYSASTAVGTGLTNYVNLTTDQTIGGQKSFTAKTTFQQVQINGQLLIGNPVDLQIRDAAGTLGTRAITGFNYLRGQNQSAAAPTYGFTNSANAGMYAVTSDTIGFATASIKRFEISTTDIIASLPVNAPLYDLLDFNGVNYRVALDSSSTNVLRVGAGFSNTFISGIVFATGSNFNIAGSLAIRDSVGTYLTALDSSAANTLRIGNGFSTVQMFGTSIWTNGNYTLNGTAFFGNTGAGAQLNARLQGTPNAANVYSLLNTSVNYTTSTAGIGAITAYETSQVNIIQSLAANQVVTLFKANPLVTSTGTGSTIYGYRGQINTLTAGTAYNIYADGTAQNFIQGVTTFGTEVMSPIFDVLDFDGVTYRKALDSVVNNQLRIGNGFALTNINTGGINLTAGNTVMASTAGSLTLQTLSSTGQLIMTTVGGTVASNGITLTNTGTMANATTNRNIVSISGVYTVTTPGVGILQALKINPILTLSGTANQTVTMIDVSPSVTSLTSGSTLYGVRSRINIDPSGATTYNIYADGTAPNYFAGNTVIGTGSTLDVSTLRILDSDGVTYRSILTSLGSAQQLLFANGFNGLSTPLTTWGLAGGATTFNSTAGNLTLSAPSAGNLIQLQSAGGGTANNGVTITGAATMTNNSNNRNVLLVSGNYTVAAAGAGTFQGIRVRPTLTLSSAANQVISMVELFPAVNSLTSGNNVYGLRSRLDLDPSGATVYNIYADGVAPNYFAGTITAKGFTDGTFASAGNVGERVEALVSGYTNYTTTATYQPITSITLTAGDWDISSFATFNSNTSTLTGGANVVFALTTISGSVSGATEGKTISYIAQSALIGTSRQSSSSMRIRVSITATTTYYLNTQATFTLGNPQYVGSMLATRVR